MWGQVEISTKNATSDGMQKINIVYPYENMSLPAVSRTFVFGSVFPSTGSFYLNGEKIVPYRTGGFLVYVPVSGDSFNASLFDGYSTYTYVRKVVIPSARQEPKKDELFINLISPSKSMEIMPGESFVFYARATAGQHLKADMENGEEVFFEETPVGSGNYYAVYRAREKDAGKSFSFSLKFKKGLFAHNSSLEPKISVKVLKSSYLLKTSTDSVILKNAISGGYTMFLPKDIILQATGRLGGYYRIKAGDHILWLDDSKASFYLPVPRRNDTETGNLVFSSSDNTVTARLAIYDRVPYLAYAQGKNFRLEFFNTDLHTNWVIYDSSDTYTKGATFRQESDGRVSFSFSFKEDIWGYDMGYSTNSFLVSFKFKPKYSGKYPKPLEGVKIVLDPGHSPKRVPPFDGAIGPSGYFEYEANMAIARKVCENLLALGASVYMTRTADEAVALVQRPLISKAFGGDLFISIHNNAIPDGEDPFSKPRGFQVYYYHPNSMPLAKSVHQAFLKNIRLPDEGLRYGDYHVIRQTYMPAILVENAYMIFPEHEEMLRSENGIREFSNSITEGILDFLGIKKPVPAVKPQKKKGG
ncbi:MAG: hypothetical protein Fur0012_11040 [Elusimicrobiota bacterium]